MKPPQENKLLENHPMTSELDYKTRRPRFEAVFVFWTMGKMWAEGLVVVLGAAADSALRLYGTIAAPPPGGHYTTLAYCSILV
jgi:hypothetical protein